MHRTINRAKHRMWNEMEWASENDDGNNGEWGDLYEHCIMTMKHNLNAQSFRWAPRFGLKYITYNKNVHNVVHSILKLHVFKKHLASHRRSRPCPDYSTSYATVTADFGVFSGDIRAATFTIGRWQPTFYVSSGPRWNFNFTGAVRFS